jgi:hypothetical protein
MTFTMQSIKSSSPAALGSTNTLEGETLCRDGTFIIGSTPLLSLKFLAYPSSIIDEQWSGLLLSLRPIAIKRNLS